MGKPEDELKDATETQELRGSKNGGTSSKGTGKQPRKAAMWVANGKDVGGGAHAHWPCGCWA